MWQVNVEIRDGSGSFEENIREIVLGLINTRHILAPPIELMAYGRVKFLVGQYLSTDLDLDPNSEMIFRQVEDIIETGIMPLSTS